MPLLALAVKGCLLPAEVVRLCACVPLPLFPPERGPRDKLVGTLVTNPVFAFL